MPTEARHIRTLLDDLSPPRHRTTRELDQEARIVAAATAAFARFGRSHITLANFAAGLRLSPATIRRHFPDLHTLLAEILRRHLLAIATAIGDANPNPLAPHAARQAAYIAATRNGFGAPTAPHILLLRDRHTLPEDLAEPIDQLRLQIGDLLAGPRADLALAILDEPTCPEPEALTLLATLSPTPHLTATPIPPANQSHPAAPAAQHAAVPPASRHRPSRTPASRLPPLAPHAARQACTLTPIPDPRLTRQTTPATRRQACSAKPTPISNAKPTRQTAPAARRQACAPTPTRHRPPNLPTPALPIQARAGPAPPG